MSYSLSLGHIRKILGKAMLFNNKFNASTLIVSENFLNVKTLHKIKSVFFEKLSIFPSFCVWEPLVLSN